MEVHSGAGVRSLDELCDLFVCLFVCFRPHLSCEDSSSLNFSSVNNQLSSHRCGCGEAFEPGSWRGLFYYLLWFPSVKPVQITRSLSVGRAAPLKFPSMKSCGRFCCRLRSNCRGPVTDVPLTHVAAHTTLTLLQVDSRDSGLTWHRNGRRWRWGRERLLRESLWSFLKKCMRWQRVTSQDAEQKQHLNNNIPSEASHDTLFIHCMELTSNTASGCFFFFIIMTMEKRRKYFGKWAGSDANVVPSSFSTHTHAQNSKMDEFAHLLHKQMKSQIF